MSRNDYTDLTEILQMKATIRIRFTRSKRSLRSALGITYDSLCDADDDVPVNINYHTCIEGTRHHSQKSSSILRTSMGSKNTIIRMCKVTSLVNCPRLKKASRCEYTH